MSTSSIIFKIMNIPNKSFNIISINNNTLVAQQFYTQTQITMFVALVNSTAKIVLFLLQDGAGKSDLTEMNDALFEEKIPQPKLT
jgi:hypothetical protein